MRQRLLTLLFALIGLTSAWAEDYGVKIGGVMLTSSNYTNITAAGGFSAVKSGTVTYDPTSKTLTLNNAVIETTSGTSAIYFARNSDSYNLVLPEGTSSSITSEAGAGLAVEAPFTIKGGGVVTLKATQDCGIFMDYNSSYDHILTISGCTVMVTGQWGIAANDEYGTLVIDNSIVFATGTSGSVCDMKGMTLTGTVLYQPTGAVWDDASHSVCSAGGTKLTSTIIYLPETGGGTNTGTGGDVNGDGNMNLADVTFLVNLILHGGGGNEGGGNEGGGGETDEHEYVNLGLPSGTLWAKCNVGAENPEDYGYYFAWGETVPRGQEDTSNTTNYIYNNQNSYRKSYYDWNAYKWCTGSETSLTKYCNRSSYGYNGFTDGLTELELADDAAYVNMGSGWRTPTKEQFEELTNNNYTTAVWTIQNGVNGLKVTSKMSGYTDKSIFLPAAEHYYRYLNDMRGLAGYYWTRSYNLGGAPSQAYELEFQSGNVLMGKRSRSYGNSIRPVRVQ